MGVVVNVQATAFVFAVSDLCHFMKGVVVTVQATAVVLQFLSFHEGGGGGGCECTGDSCCVAASVIS